MTLAPAQDVAVRLDHIRQRIVDAGANPETVRIVAVTKGFGVGAIEAALAAGVADVGENYAQEMTAKLSAAAAGVRWHFLGSMQRNKLARLAPHVSLWHGLSAVSEAEALAARRPHAAVLVQVNVAGDPAKHGALPTAAPEVVERARQAGLDVRGLMAVGPAGDRLASRRCFAAVTQLADRLGLPERSMGMSDDLEEAVAEGATMVRIGRALFGPRPVGPK
jgi:pyridoxal phosphate enzyme (YggS family)